MVSEISKFSAAVSIIGIIIIAIFCYTEPPRINISKINDDDIGKIYIVSGNLVEIYKNDETIFMKISDEDYELKAVMFGSNNNFINSLEKNTNISIEGKIQKYRNETEIIAYKIKII